MKQTKHLITKQFIGGLLKGITIQEWTSSANFKPGFICRKPCAGSPYKITAVDGLPKVINSNGEAA